MAASGSEMNSGAGEKPPGRKRRGGRILLWILGIVLLVLVGMGVAAQIALDRAEPMLRARVLDTLATRYDSRIELDRFHVSVIRGFEAEGDGLRLYPNGFLTPQPFIAIAKFTFRVSWLSLVKTPMHVGEVDVEGMTINIPPKDQRGQTATASSLSRAPSASPAPVSPVTGSETTATPINPNAHQPGIKMYVDEVVIRNLRILIGISKPGKLPLDFEVSRIALHSIGPGKPLRFEATLVNPKPIGNIQSTGFFGPFNQGSPGDSPVSGSYSFTHADLATFKGIGGILASTGKYQGPLNHLTVDGEANVPDFRLNTGGHPMPLRTVYHAIVDGITGDTYLQPVHAQLGRSPFIVTGSIVKVRGGDGQLHGHDITLDVTMDRARIEDFLKLAVRTDPPVMNGNLRMKARIFIPPGNVPVTQKLHLDGNFEVSGAYFSSDKIQDKIGLLSRLGQGHPKDPDLHVSPPQPEVKVPADVRGDFVLASGSMTFSDLDFDVPGAKVDMAGVYTLDGSKFDFHGHAKLAAHPSQMTTGWKSALLKLADPFFAKQGYGTVVPIEVNGTKSDPHFGLDFGRKEQDPKSSKAQSSETQ
jgi:hypothetical protein